MPPRVQALSAKRAVQLIRRGQPFIVTDMVDNWPMKDWDCDTISTDFGHEVMVPWNAYDGGTLPEAVQLREPWRQMVLPQEKDPESGLGTGPIPAVGGWPERLAFHWYAMEGGAGSSQSELVRGASKSAIDRLQGSYSLPYFLDNRSSLNTHFCTTTLQSCPHYYVLVLLWLSLIFRTPHIRQCTRPLNFC